MARNDRLEDIKRRFQLLSELNGRLIVCADGPFLVSIERIRDAGLLAHACATRGAPTSAELAQGALCLRPPLAVTRSRLGAMQRDLKALAQVPGLWQFVAENSRTFRRFGAEGKGWLEDRQRQLESLTSRLAEKPVCAGEGEPLPAIMSLIAAAHGDTVVQAVRESARLTLSLASRSLSDARARAGALAKAVGKAAPGVREPDWSAVSSPEEIVALGAAELLRIRARGGRAWQRRVMRLVARVLWWPVPPADDWEDIELPDAMGKAVERAASEVLREQRPQPKVSPEDVRQVLTLYGLSFPLREPVALTAEDVALAKENWRMAMRDLAPFPLSFPQALALLKEKGKASLSRWARFVSAGMPLALLERISELRLASELERFEDPELAHAWAEWVVRLVPWYQVMGLKFSLPAAAFRRVAKGRGTELAVLAHCLVAHQADPSEARLRSLAATLGLFGRVPRQAADLVEKLRGTTPGLGRRTCPEFAAWLEDDSQLDRYLHLLALCGEPLRLSRTLQRDFRAVDRSRGQIEHLEAKQGRTGTEERRLAKLRTQARDAGLPTPDWTRRRLAEQVSALEEKAFHHQIALACRDVLRAACGIAVPELSPAWLDAVRFYLGVTKNRELLGELLRFAAEHPRAPIAMTRAQNRAWLHQARTRFDTEAWLAHREWPLTLGGRSYTLATEEDPLEVLRMGIPFRTCLSLEDGFNAASTVINALDANKRVLYLRDGSGTIVARKLLAVSERWRLLGYRLYCSLGEGREAEVERAFLTACTEIADAAGLAFDTQGVPAQLHAGFWYDDGTVAFTAKGGKTVEAYCRSLGKSAFEDHGELRAEAELWLAREQGDAAGACHVLADAWHRGDHADCFWILDSKPGPDARVVAGLRLRQAWQRSVADMLRVFSTAPRDSDTWDLVYDLFERVPRTPENIQALVRAVRARPPERGERFDNHGPEHGTMYLVPPLMGVLPLRVAFELCDELAVIWDGVVASCESCESCRTNAVMHLAAALTTRYRVAPEPQVVEDVLRSRRRSVLAHTVALQLAASFRLGPSGAWAVDQLSRRLPKLGNSAEGEAARARQAADYCPDSKDLAWALLENPRASQEEVAATLEELEERHAEAALELLLRRKQGLEGLPCRRLLMTPLSEELLVRAWRWEEYRQVILESIESRWSALWARTLSRLSRLAPAQTCAEMLDGALRLRLGRKDDEALRELWEPHLQARARRVALEMGAEAGVRLLASMRPDREASAFVDELVSKLPRAALSAALKDKAEGPLPWLREALAGSGTPASVPKERSRTRATRSKTSRKAL